MTAVSAPTPAPRLGVNMLANYAGKVWSVAAIYAFVPFYIDILGIAAYGLIAFHAIALAVLSMADAGLSAAFSREVARASDVGALRRMLASVECLLLGLLIVAGTAMVLCAPLIATDWLGASQSLPLDTAIACLRWMPLALVPQVAMSLYTGGLMGQQRQVAANALNAALTAARSGLVLLPLLAWPQPQTFFIWQAITGWLFLLVARQRLLAGLGTTEQAVRPSLQALRSIAAFAGGMFAMAIISGLNTQLDRMVVSKLRPLEDLAFYTLAATLAQVPAMLAIPIGAAIQPRFTKLVEARRPAMLAALYDRTSHMVSTVAAIAAAGLWFFAPELLAVWLNGKPVPQELPLVVRMLGLGGLALALQLPVFQLSLAHGHTRINVVLGFAALTVSIPLQIYLTQRHGLVGAAAPWLLVNSMALLVLGTVLNRQLGVCTPGRWFGRLLLPPVLTSIVALGLARGLSDAWAVGPWPALFLATVAAAMAAILAFVTRPRSTDVPQSMVGE